MSWEMLGVIAIGMVIIYAVNWRLGRRTRDTDYYRGEHGPTADRDDSPTDDDSPGDDGDDD